MAPGALRRFATLQVMVLALLVAPTATAGAAAPRPAELSPTSIRFKTPVVAGQNVYFDSGIQNFGDQGTGVFNIKWLVDGREVGAYGSHEDVPSGSSKLNGNSQFNHTFSDPGSFHTITFVVDADNHVKERFEGNNRQSVQVRVR
jgi:subtilase family serine protease